MRALLVYLPWELPKGHTFPSRFVVFFVFCGPGHTDLQGQFRPGGHGFRQYGQLKKQNREAESEERRYNGAKVSRKKIHRREMLGKSRNAVFFNDLCVGWIEK